MSLTATVLPRQATPRSLPPVPAHTHAAIRHDDTVVRTFVSQRAAEKYIEGHRESGGEGLYLVTIDGRLPPPEPETKRYRKSVAKIATAIVRVCGYCGLEPRVHERLMLSHMTPVSRGGTSSPGNLTVACESCARAKGDRTPEEWADAILAAKPVTEEQAVAGLELEWEGLCCPWSPPWVEAALIKLGYEPRRRDILYRAAQHVPGDAQGWKAVSR